MRGDLLGPLERRIAGPRPADGVVRRRAGQAPPVHEADRLLNRGLAAVEAHDLVRRADEGTFAARSVVAEDVDDERVVQLPHRLDRIDHAADLVVGVFEEVGVVLGLPREQLPVRLGLTVPRGNLLRPLRQLAALRDQAGFQLVLVNDLRGTRPIPCRSGPCSGHASRVAADAARGPSRAKSTTGTAGPARSTFVSGSRPCIFRQDPASVDTHLPDAPEAQPDHYSG